MRQAKRWRCFATSDAVPAWQKVLRGNTGNQMHRAVRTGERPMPLEPTKSPYVRNVAMTLPGFTAQFTSVVGVHRYRHETWKHTTTANAAVTAQVDWPNEFHGNWCGPGHSGPGAPIDAVDEACCRHDQCFCTEGYDDCSCNRQAVLRLPGAIADWSTSAHGRVVGLAIATALAAAPCLCHEILTPFGWKDSPLPFPSIAGICPFPWK